MFYFQPFHAHMPGSPPETSRWEAEREEGGPQAARGTQLVGSGLS